jgi:hypothetical protein
MFAGAFIGGKGRNGGWGDGELEKRPEIVVCALTIAGIHLEARCSSLDFQNRQMVTSIVPSIASPINTPPDVIPSLILTSIMVFARY